MLEGKNALITGASRGIGRAIALKLASEGANVAIVYAGNTEAAERTRDEARGFGVKAECYLCDVSNFIEVGELVKKVNDQFGIIHILINNAGITSDKLVMRMTEDEFSNVINVNLKGAFNLIRHTSGGFLRARTGRIINISSVSGLMGNAGQANYAAAKAGLIGLTKSVAKELAGRNVTCNAIAPGFIETDMTGKLPEDIKNEYLRTIPLGRYGAPSDIGELAAFLASDKAAYITGAVIAVDGGLSM
jgi:3-oxoacyl-[acyl-carrier protein] reductase